MTITPFDIIKSVIPDLKGARILDVGCGHGGLVRSLLMERALAFGIDPQPAVIERAAASAGAGVFQVAGA